MTRSPSAWPTYVGSNPNEGPGCGVTAHEAECLCDVRLPVNHPTRTYVGRLAFASLAEDALLSRGIDDPTTLQVVQQMLALKDAAANFDLGPAMELLIAWQATPTDDEIIELRGPLSGDPQLDGAAHSRAHKGFNDKRRGLLQEALRRAPVAVVANALGTTSAAIVGEAWNHSATRIEIVVKEALQGQPVVDIAARAHMGPDTLRAILAVFKVPSEAGRRSKKTVEILALAKDGMSMVDISKKLGVPHDTVRKIAYGRRGPLHSLQVRIDALVRRGWTEPQIHAEVGDDTAIVDRLIGASKRSHSRLDHLAKTSGRKVLVAA